MIEFFPFKKDIPFMRWGRVTTFISLDTFILAVAALATKGLHLGVDFTGGTLMEVAYKHPADLGAVRSVLEKTGLPEVSVQTFGTSRDVLIRLPLKGGGSAAETSNTVMQALKGADATVELKRVDFVGPQVGKELYDSGAERVENSPPHVSERIASYGIHPLPPRGGVVSNEMIDRLRDIEGI